ncbi:catalase family peroxidase [Paenibacillus sp. JCM 10914]|uniref:catalase family peroxidase n=1 Tax=Paenibacillus sp. JCM 10914 TaxID=1236974 RepID=UPI0003CC931C|nr:catalase family peroxidase [Paenibacillus sp. JCM 10914]GAE06289.1 catalase [Paenibacillus sp. JCM 10914]
MTDDKAHQNDGLNPQISHHTALTVQTIDAIEQVGGLHPGSRRAHAKGICCSASFRPSGQGARYTAAPHLQKQAVDLPAIVRFSGVSPDPTLADLLSPAKGMAVQFSLPSGSVTNLVGATIPVFLARTPESFLDIIQAVNRAKQGEMGPIDLIAEIIEHFAESKESLMAVRHLKPPASYVTSQYFCIHAYHWIDSIGSSRPVKFEWVPVAGVETLSMKDAAQQSENYLEVELRHRLSRGSAVFQLIAVLGEEGDPTNDPTRAWPLERERIDLGWLTIAEVLDREPSDLVMDPTLVPEGMALSDDPILQFRRDAYVESFRRRREGH